jgi:hypothetical protein
VAEALTEVANGDDTARKLGLPDDPAVREDLQTLSASAGTDRPSQSEWGLRARARPAGKANRLAVFALFCAFVVPVLGIVFGLVALDEISDADGRERGEGLAKWAVGLGALWLVLAVAFAVWLVVAH